MLSGDGVFDLGPRKSINKSIKCQLLPVGDAVGFTAAMALGAFWILTEPFASAEINTVSVKLKMFVF